MGWLPIALRYVDLLIKYGPTAYAIAVEAYRLIEKLRKEGKPEAAEARKLALDYEIAFYKAVPRRLRKIEGIRNVRDGARKDAGVA